MFQFVTLDEAKAHLYILLDETEDDPLVQGMVFAASGAVRNYIQGCQPWQPYLDSNMLPEVDSNGDVTYEVDSNGDKLVRSEVKQATLLLIGYFYKNRDENPNSEFDKDGYLPAPVKALLYPLRVPTLR